MNLSCGKAAFFLVAASLALLLGPGGGLAQKDKVLPLVLREDDAPRRTQAGLVKGSHVKVFIPSLPYLYTSHAINAALIKPANNPRGWEYDMATAHRKIDDKTYEFTLRQGVSFQDGSPFNADAVVLNMEYFKKKPFLYSKIDKVFERAEKIDDHTVRFHLKEKYGCFLNDAIWMQFYTAAYLKKFGWNGKATCPNLAEAGPYGLGPYILKKGYVEGDRSTAEVILEANPHYWDRRYPKVETITLYTQLKSATARNTTLYEEGKLDITIIPPQHKVETVQAPYSKLIISPSTDNIAIHMNLRNGHPKLLEKSVRRALNEAVHPQNLLHFVYEGEGYLSPISPLFPGVRQVARTLHWFPEEHDAYTPEVQQRLRGILGGLKLKVLTQDRFLPLWRGLESQLKRVGVTLEIIETRNENEVFGTLLKTNARQNEQDWDLLVWGNDDWFFNHPFTVFFVYRTHNVWSTVFDDPTMDGYIEEMFRASVDDPEFVPVCEKIMRRAHDHAYMLFVPTPHRVYAVNKEVVFRPYTMACIPLWEIQVTDQHWSVRQGSYPEHLKHPVQVLRCNFKD